MHQPDIVQPLDPRETHHRVSSQIPGRRLFLRYLPPASAGADRRRVVLYVHGGTFPSALSIAHRFDGRSWRDELCDAGFHVWGLDFLGFGASDRYAEMDEPADRYVALGGAVAAAIQLERAIHYICDYHGTEGISLIAHSWGTIAVGRFMGDHPDLVNRAVFFGPVTWRTPKAPSERFPAWRLVTLEDQWNRFSRDVPGDELPVLARRDFETWGEYYLDSDPKSRTRCPHAVQTPSGPWQDIADAWAGQLAYDPGRVRVPVAIIRGEWDSVITDADARWLFDSLNASPMRRDVKIARATHLMHLEEARYALYHETATFLLGCDRPEEGRREHERGGRDVCRGV